MNNKIAFIISLMVLCVMPFGEADAQQQNYRGSIDVTLRRLEQAGDSLYIDMDVILSRVHVRSNLSVELTPTLKSPLWESSLPAVLVKGRSSYKAYQRSLKIDGGPADITEPYAVVKGYPVRDVVINYKYSVRYEPWMADAGLNLVREDAGCCNKSVLGFNQITDHIKTEPRPVLEEIMITPYVAFVTPAAEAVKSREIQAEVRLDFAVNKTDINLSYMNNPRELSRIKGIIDELRNDPSITIVGLEIIGYASPEGSLANNRKLSEGRALALRNYLASQYDFPRSIYRVSFGGENWDGLIKALQAQPVDYTDEVLAVIRSTNPDQNRKNRLKALRGGVPYRQMLSDIYPQLRTAVCKIDYRIKGFDAQDALEVFRTRPQNLSLNEFYLVSNTMREGSPEFIEVFEMAVRMYPADDIANINAAVAAIQDRNAERAQNYLAKVTSRRDLPEYENAAGALEVLKKNYGAARPYFERAAAKGLEAATLNLGILPEELNRKPHF